MLRIWQKTEKQKLEPVGMGTAFPFLKEKNHVVSIIGGGGKTTLLYEMAGFCVKNDQKVLVTTSTHIYRPPKEWHDQSLEAVERKFRTGRAAIIGSACRDPEKLSMPETELFEEARKKADLTLIEADGARHLPPAEEGGNLQNIHIFGSHGGFFGCMNVGHGRYSEGGVHFLQYLQRLFVADAHKGIQAGAVGFAVRPFEYIGDLQFFGDSHDTFGNAHCHFFSFDDTWTCQ